MADHPALETAVAAARAALDGADDRGPGPRYELFNAPNSICAQKVRTVLAQHHLPYLSHGMNLFKGETYLPAYVRLRMIGCDSLGGALVAHHSGSTATSAGGCDGAVVPTLVDWETGEVVVDSRRICLHLDARMPEAERLRPAALAEVIDAELEIVDNLPNYQMLMGRNAAAESAAADFSTRKVAWCDRYLEDHGDDATLVRAYRAKRAKELSAATGLFSPEAMRAAYGRAERAVRDLEGRLAQAKGGWLFGERITLADLFWAIELLRMRNVGVAAYWEGGRAPAVERFLAEAEALPAIRAAILDWPGAMF